MVGWPWWNNCNMAVTINFSLLHLSSSSGTAIRWPFPTMKSKKTKRGANLDHFAAADITFKAIKFKNYGSRWDLVLPWKAHTLSRTCTDIMWALEETSCKRTMGISKKVGFVLSLPQKRTSNWTLLAKRNMSSRRVYAKTPPTTSCSHRAGTIKSNGWDIPSLASSCRRHVSSRYAN